MDWQKKTDRKTASRSKEYSWTIHDPEMDSTTRGFDFVDIISKNHIFHKLEECQESIA